MDLSEKIGNLAAPADKTVMRERPGMTGKPLHRRSCGLVAWKGAWP